MGAALLFLWSLGGASGQASPGAGDDPELLIHRGVELRKQGKDREAEELFLRAYERARTPRAAAQLGLVEFALEQVGEAERYLSESLLSHEPWIESNRKVLENTRVEVRKRLASISFVGATIGTTVVVRSGPSVPLPADGTLWVVPGPLSLRIEPPGGNPITRTADAKPGEHMTIDVNARPSTTPVPEPAPVAAPPSTLPAERPVDHADTSSDRGHGLRVAGIATGAVGVAAGITGAILYQIAGTKLDHIKSRSYSKSDLDWQTYDHAGVGLMIGGAVTAAAGAAMYLFGNREGSSAGVNVSLDYSPGARAGLVVGGAF